MTAIEQLPEWLGAGFFGALAIYVVAIGACCLFTTAKKFLG
jgi:hypothetical protein